MRRKIAIERQAVELGRGGRYKIGGDGEPATGFSLYTDTVRRALPEPAPVRILFVPHGASAGTAARLRAEGWVVIAGLAPVEDAVAEAKRLRCAALLDDGRVRAID